jgi:hypothetical protein
MVREITRITFLGKTDMDAVNATLNVAMTATSILHGVDRVERLDRPNVNYSFNTVTLDCSDKVGKTLTLIFVGFIRREYRRTAYHVERRTRIRRRANRKAVANG